MDFFITDNPDQNEEQFIIKSLWAHNSAYAPVDIHPLLINTRNSEGEIICGLISRTWWGALEIQYLWVVENHRKQGLGSRLMKTAEEEALKRGCHLAYVDTFNFQAVGFYKKLGYAEYGSLPGYAHKYERHYLAKHIKQD